MSLSSLEREIVRGARIILKNRRVRLGDLLDGPTGNVTVGEGEVSIFIEEYGVTAVFFAECDKRKAAVTLLCQYDQCGPRDESGWGHAAERAIRVRTPAEQADAAWVKRR